MKNATKIRQLLIRARQEVKKLSPAAICYPLYKERIPIATLDEALALLPCETCGGTGKKPRPKGQRHCHLLLCQDLTCSCEECDFYIPQDPCPDCQKKP